MADTHQTTEQVFGEPAPAELGWRVLEPVGDLGGNGRFVETHEVRFTQVTVVLGNFEFQDQ